MLMGESARAVPTQQAPRSVKLGSKASLAFLEINPEICHRAEPEPGRSSPIGRYRQRGTTHDPKRAHRNGALLYERRSALAN